MPTDQPPPSVERRPTLADHGLAAMPGDSRTRSPLATFALRLLRVTVLVYILWVAALWFLQDTLLFLPDHAGEGLSEAAISAEPRIERHWLPQDDGIETEAWLVRALPAGSAPRGLVVFLHGNAELIDHALHEAEEWTQRGYDVMLPEYRGYGRTGGTPGETRIVADVLAHIERDVAANGARRILLHGRSLGTGVAAQVARQLSERSEASHGGLTSGGFTPGGLMPGSPHPEALILESPFTSVASFAAGFGAPAFIVRHSFRTDEVLPRLACPVLILHARDDEVVPVAHGRTLAGLAPRAEFVELDGSHNSGLSSDEAYWSATDRLIDR